MKIKNIILSITLILVSIFMLVSCKKEKFTVRLLNEDNSLYEEVTVVKGDIVQLPTLEKEGHTFDGWYLNEDKVEQNPIIEQNYEFVAKFTINNYTYKFVIDGQVIKEETLPYGSDITYPENPSKDQSESKIFTFEGWDNDATKLLKDETFNALFDSEDRLYKIIFKDANGIEILTQEAKFGDVINYPDAPEKEETDQYSYEFIKWSITDETVSKDLTISPVYDEIVKKYTYKFVDDEGNVLKEELVNYGTMPVAPNKPKKEGFKFVGWDKQIAKVTGDVVYTAVFEEEGDPTLEGKLISFMGDSITTFYAEGSEMNSYYSGTNTFYYPLYSSSIKTVDKTWWYQLIKNNKMKLGINNSWSGSAACGSGSSAGQSDNRINTLDENGLPDIVIIYLGTNDLGSGYTTEQFGKAIETMIKKIRALGVEDIFIVTLGYTKYTNDYYSEAGRLEYNAKIRELATTYSCGVIPLDEYVINDNYMIYLGDRLHYNAKGATLLSLIAEKAMKEYYGIPFEGEIEVEHKELLPEGVAGKIVATANDNFWGKYENNVFFVESSFTNPTFSTRYEISENADGTYYISAIYNSGEICTFNGKYVIIVSDVHTKAKEVLADMENVEVGCQVEFNSSLEFPLEIIIKEK